jgi:hypothetical protein
MRVAFRDSLVSFQFLGVGWDWVHFVTSAANWPIVPTPDDIWWIWSSRRNENWQRKPKYSKKTCPSATLSTTNPTCPDLGSNPGRRGGKPATNRLSYATASWQPEYRLILSWFNHNYNVQTKLIKIQHYQILWKSVLQLLHADGQTKRVTKPILASFKTRQKRQIVLLELDPTGYA